MPDRDLEKALLKGSESIRITAIITNCSVEDVLQEDAEHEADFQWPYSDSIVDFAKLLRVQVEHDRDLPIDAKRLDAARISHDMMWGAAVDVLSQEAPE